MNEEKKENPAEVQAATTAVPQNRQEEAKDALRIVPSNVGTLLQSEGFRRAEEAFKRVYGNEHMTEEKKRMLRVMEHMMTDASDAYRAAQGVNGENDQQRIFKAGDFAYLYFIQFHYLCELYGSHDTNVVLEVVQKSIDWMKSKGWDYSLSIQNEDGSVSHKTCAGINSDMARFIETRRKLIQMLEQEQQSQSGVKK